MEWQESLPCCKKSHRCRDQRRAEGRAQSTVNSRSMTPTEFVKIGSLDNLTMAH
jgi:hypothetical protein